MKTKEITIAGMTLMVTFNIATEIAFETIVQRPFNLQDIETQTDQAAFCMAAITSCKENTDTPDDCFSRIIHDSTKKEYSDMVNAVSECMMDFYDIPENVISDDGKTDVKDNKEVPEEPKN